MKAYVIYLNEAEKKHGELNEKEEDRIADFLGKILRYSGEVRSELTGNITTFEVGKGCKPRWVIGW